MAGMSPSSTCTHLSGPVEARLGVTGFRPRLGEVPSDVGRFRYDRGKCPSGMRQRSSVSESISSRKLADRYWIRRVKSHSRSGGGA